MNLDDEHQDKFLQYDRDEVLTMVDHAFRMQEVDELD